MKPMKKKLAGRGSRLLSLALAPAFAASLTSCSYSDSDKASTSTVRASVVSSTSADSGAATTNTPAAPPAASTCSATGLVPGLDLLLVNAGGTSSAGLQNSILGNLGQLLGQLPSNTNFNIGVLNPNGTLASGSSELTQWVSDLSTFTSRFQAWGYAANVSINPTVISQMKGIQDPSDIKNFGSYVQSFPIPTDLAMLYGSLAGRADALPNISGVSSVVSGTTGVTNVADLQGVLAGLLGSSTAPVPGAASGNGLQAILNLFGGNGNLGTAMGAGMFQPGSALGLLFAGDPSNNIGICLEGAGGACNGGGANDILGMLQGFMGGGQVGIGSFFSGMPGMTGTGATGGMPNLTSLFGGLFGGQMGGQLGVGQGGMNSPANILALLSGGLAIPATGDSDVSGGMGQMGQLLAGLLGGGVTGGATGCSPLGGFDFGSLLGGLGNFGGLGGVNGGLGNIFGGLLGGSNGGLGGLAGLFPSLNGATTGGEFGGLSQILSLFGGFGGTTPGVGGLTGFPGLNGLIPGLAMPGGFGGIPGMPSLGVTDNPLSMITNLFGGLGGSANGGLGGIFGGLLGGTAGSATNPMAGLGGLFGGLNGSASNPLAGLFGGGTNPMGGLFGASNPMMGGLSMLPMLGQLPSLVGGLFGGIVPPVATAPTAPATGTTPVTSPAPATGLGGIFGNLFGGLFGGGLFGSTPGLLPDPVAGS